MLTLIKSVAKSILRNISEIVSGPGAEVDSRVGAPLRDITYDGAGARILFGGHRVRLTHFEIGRSTGGIFVKASARMMLTDYTTILGSGLIESTQGGTIVVHVSHPMIPGSYSALLCGVAIVPSAGPCINGTEDPLEKEIDIQAESLFERSGRGKWQHIAGKRTSEVPVEPVLTEAN